MGVGPDDNGTIEFQFEKRPQLTKWEAFKKTLYDPETKQILGRTSKNWGQLLLFYAIFYAVLAAMFAACMQGLFATLDSRTPMWTLDSSLIGTNPGLGFRPISARTEEGSLIWYNRANSTTIEKWVRMIDDFLIPYKREQTGQNFVNCDFSKPPEPGKVCVTDIKQLGNCNPSQAYGYNSSSPCVFLKLNRIFGWEPKFYTEAEPDMPDELKMHIENNTKSSDERKQIWVSCQGLDEVDRENIGSFSYYPHGFAGYYYPYRNDPNYLSPIIAVQVMNITPNVIVSIECRAWAKNIEYRGGSLNRAGSVTFELQVDSDSTKQK